MIPSCAPGTWHGNLGLGVCPAGFLPWWRFLSFLCLYFYLLEWYYMFCPITSQKQVSKNLLLDLNIFILCSNTWVYMCVGICVWVHACHSMYVAVRGQLVGIGSLFPWCGLQGLNPGHQVAVVTFTNWTISLTPVIWFLMLWGLTVKRSLESWKWSHLHFFIVLAWLKMIEILKVGLNEFAVWDDHEPMEARYGKLGLESSMFRCQIDKRWTYLFI